MATDPYIYEIFISYRQVEHDRVVADALQRSLEAFRTPRTLVRAGVRKRLKRVFRDRTELAASSDLGAELKQALKDSRFLVVICSKQTPESIWVAEEIRTFQRYGRGDRILALLVDGEPAESFPKPLTDSAGESELLAADIRASTIRESLKILRKTGKIRILAPVLGVSYDDLWRRHWRRTKKRRLIASAVSAMLVTVVLGLALVMVKEIRQTHVTNAVTNLVENSVRLVDEGGSGLAALLALQAHRLETPERSAQYSKVYEALRKSLTTQSFNQVLSSTGARITSMSISADGRYLALGREDGAVELRNPYRNDDTVLKTYFENAIVKSVVFHPDAKRLVVGLDEGDVWLAHIDGNEIRKSQLGLCHSVETLAVSPNGKLAAVGTVRDGLCLLELDQSGRVRWVEYDGITRAIGFSPSSSWMATGGKEKLDIWAINGKEVSSKRAFAMENETVTAIALTDRYLAVGSFQHLGAFIQSEIMGNATPTAESIKRGLVRIWDLQDMSRKPRVLETDPQRVLALAFSPDEDKLIAAGVDSELRQWTMDNLDAGPLLLSGHDGDVFSLTFDPIRGALASAGGADGTIRLWAFQFWPDMTIETRNTVVSLAFLDNDTLVGAVKMSKSPTIWNVRKSPPLMQTSSNIGIDGYVTAVASDPNHHSRLVFGTSLALGSSPDTNVRVWDLASSQYVVSPFAIHTSDVEALALDATGKRMASAGYLDGLVKITEMDTGDYVTVKLPTQSTSVRAVAFHPVANSMLLAIAADESVVVFPDFHKPEWIRLDHDLNPLAQDSRVTDLEFTSSGDLLATAATDGTVRLWRTGEWNKPVHTIERQWRGSPYAALEISFDPMQPNLAVGYGDGSILIWNVEDLATHPLTVQHASVTPIHSLVYSPDGSTLAAGFEHGGIRIWSSPSALITQSCDLLVRNLTQREWNSFVGPNLKYERTCDSLPAGF